MQLRSLLICFTVLPACLGTETVTVSPEQPLAKLSDAKLVLGGFNPDRMRLDIQTAGCPRLEMRVSVDFERRVGDFDRGGRQITEHDEIGTANEHCEGPSVEWQTSTLPTIGAPTITVSDPETTWTFTIDQPAVQRHLALVAPQETYHPGDTLAFRVDAAAQLVTADMSAMIVGGTHDIFDERTVPITFAANELSFTLPSVAEITIPTVVKLNVGVHATPPILGCTAQGGCIAGGEQLDANVTFTFAPFGEPTPN